MNPKDTITVDVPLFIRLLEYAREDAQTDMDLHDLADNIIQLSEEPRPSGYKKLQGRAAYRIRVGQYRVIYEVKDQIMQVLVIAIGSRKDIYRK